MSTEIKARIDEEIAKLSQLVPFPKSPFGYGSDISGDFDVDRNMDEVNPFSTLGLAQSLVRRLDCPRGENRDDPDYGIGLRQMVNRGTTEREFNQLAGQIRLELMKDDRVDNIIVVVTPLDAGKRLRVQLQVSAVDVNIGSFGLTLSASSAEILLEEIRSER